MTRLRQDSITDQVRQLLQRGIESGRLKPGQRIFEETLARDLGISKTPLRLALHQLKQDGLVRISPRRGIYVAVPTLSEAMQLMEMREVLEGLAARRAARQHAIQTIERMKACFAGFDEASLADNRLKYAAADHRFHGLLVRASGSRELIKTLDVINLRVHMNRLRRAFSLQHDLLQIHREHLDIIAAIEAGDAHRAEALVRRHVRNVPWQTVLKTDEAWSADAASRSEAAA